MRSPAAISPTLCSVSRSLSSSVGDAPFPAARSKSARLASSSPAHRTSSRSAAAWSAASLSAPDAAANSRDALTARRPRSSRVPVTVPGYPASQAITTRSSR